MRSEHDLLAVVDNMNQALAQAVTFQEVKKVRDEAELLLREARLAAMRKEVANYAAEVKLRAERKAGELLIGLSLRGGDRKSKGNSHTLTLAALGITTSRSARWQLEASIPVVEFECYLRDANARGEEISSASLLRFAKERIEAAAGYVRRHKRLRQIQTNEGRRVAITDETADRIAEANEHVLMLIRILQPLCAGKRVAMEPAERNYAARLLADTRQLLAEVLDS